MKLHFWTDGDSSVGIQGCAADVEIFGLEDTELDNQAFTIGVLRDAFKEVFNDGRVHVADYKELL